MTAPASGSGKTAAAMSFTFVVLYLSGLSAFGSFVNDMYSPSLPSMARFFGCTASTAQLGLSAGMVGLALGQIFLGPFSYKYGRKTALLLSLLLFLAAAAVSIFSPTIHFFIATRLFQGMGAAGGYFLARTIPADIYSGRTLAKCMAVMGGINGIAPASAPVIGGFVSEYYTWKGVFVALAAFCLILLLISPALKETMPPSERPKGSLWSNFRNYPTLLRNSRFMTHCLFKGSALGLLFAYISATPFIFQVHFGWSASYYGLFIGFNALFVAAGSVVSLRFHPLKKAAFVGSVLLVVAAVSEGIALWFFHDFWLCEALLIPMCFSLGLIFAVTNTLAMNEGRRFAGAASAILGVSGYVFGAIVTPLVGVADIPRSTAIVLIVMSLITLFFSFRSRSIPADLMDSAPADAPAPQK